ncbi:MAG: hypothetical protein NTV75_04690 [Bacteroidia bacterium]|nr:hypothetical protein [Bacteroidia bacterium]
MKKYLLILGFISCCSLSQAQYNNWYFSFSMGGSWPKSTYANSLASDKSSGYAEKGFSLVIDATFPLNDHWGLKGMTLINTNTVDNDGMQKLLTARVPSVISANDPSKFSYTSNPWMWNALLGGPVYTLNLGRFYWDLQLLGGLNLTYLPQQKLQYNDPANKWYYSDTNSTSMNSSFGILAGTAFRFPISQQLNLKLGFDYYRSDAKVSYQQTRTSQQADGVNTEVLAKGSYSIPLRMITGTIGFVYYLN